MEEVPFTRLDDKDDDQEQKDIRLEDLYQDDPEKGDWYYYEEDEEQE